MCAALVLTTCASKQMSKGHREHRNYYPSNHFCHVPLMLVHEHDESQEGVHRMSIGDEDADDDDEEVVVEGSYVVQVHADEDTMDLDSLEAIAQDESVCAGNRKRLNLNGVYRHKSDAVGDGANAKKDDEDTILPDQFIRRLSDPQAISLRSNNLHAVPGSVLRFTSLMLLDLADNHISVLTPEIGRLIKNFHFLPVVCNFNTKQYAIVNETVLRLFASAACAQVDQSLQELILDQNVLGGLPASVWDLKCLKILRIGQNNLVLPPDQRPSDEMRTLVFSDNEVKQENSSKTNFLTNLNLRANRLKGNIILGNYGSLTELDVSDNAIEHLDLSAVEQLQSLQCSRNNLSELILFGKNLTSIIAGNNNIQEVTVNYTPTHLKHFDISYNDLTSLPEWLCCSLELRSLFASNNQMKNLPDRLFCNEMSYLHTLQLAYNQLESLPSIQVKIPLKEMFLQNNNLSILPESFFHCFPSIRVLNLSNNRLCDLPQTDNTLHLEKLFITANCLSDKSLNRLSTHLPKLKSLFAAYNNFTCLPENSPQSWPDIEELVISGNKLLHLPHHIGRMCHLRVLRVHSNLLQNIPKLSDLWALKILDLAHNQLDRIDLNALIPPQLKFLDLSCNIKLHVDSQQFHTYRTQRPMSLVDVSGKNRTSLPISPMPFCENQLNETCWTVGFSETSGSNQKLYVSQIRLPAFCNTEGLFGIFDGENNCDIPVAVDKVVPRILLEERTVKETSADYLKYTMLSAHRELKDKGQKHGMNAIIVHILQAKVNPDYSFGGSINKYVMKIATVGDVRVVLGKVSGPIRLLPNKQRKATIRTNPQLQLMVPDPDIAEIFLDDQDEFMIIANKNLWAVMSPDIAIKEVSLQRNVILAAKRLQDLAQSYGAEENLSIIVVKFNLLGSDVDMLMKELRQTIRKNKLSGTCLPGCCCEALSNECVNCEKLSMPIMVNHDDRSSPSGQSEHGLSDYTSPAKAYINQMNKQLENRSLRSITPHFESQDMKISPERRSYRGVARAVRARREEDQKQRNEETDSALSEEQFKCWEYMLEQNTQLLFDKELNTINHGSSRRTPFTLKNSSLSRSSPHLSQEASTHSNNSSSFLSRQFGSARSFNPIFSRQSGSRLSMEKKVMGGPHAAYFGSLQRLMPYNLEYDFAVMQERGLADSLDLDRMQQYWGVTTTEL